MTPPDRMTMIERVARAIHAVQLPIMRSDGAMVGVSQVPLSAAQTMARAAIAAMRDPTEGMCHAAMLTIVRENKGIEYGPYIGWQAMIDAALGVDETKGAEGGP